MRNGLQSRKSSFLILNIQNVDSLEMCGQGEESTAENHDDGMGAVRSTCINIFNFRY